MREIVHAVARWWCVVGCQYARRVVVLGFDVSMVDVMRTTLLAVVALAVLRIVVGLHFFLEGLSHLRDPSWSSAGFRKAAVGPLADFYRSSLPEVGDWSVTLGGRDRRSATEAAAAWQESVVQSWRDVLAARSKAVPLDSTAREAAEAGIAGASKELASYLEEIGPDLDDYRMQVDRLDAQARQPSAQEVPFERKRVADKRRELAAMASGWQADAAAIGDKLVAAWDGALAPADRIRAAAAVPPTSLWKADRFVSWALVAIGACLVLGILVPFNAMGGVFFLASVIASQPFWVTGAQSTYDQWVELAALLVLATMPIGGWRGLDYFLRSWCPLGCSRGIAR
jgi:uncharacterized membrane protein YphA (DoxX/SURF4 family)